MMAKLSVGIDLLTESRKPSQDPDMYQRRKEAGDKETGVSMRLFDFWSHVTENIVVEGGRSCHVLTSGT